MQTCEARNAIINIPTQTPLKHDTEHLSPDAQVDKAIQTQENTDFSTKKQQNQRGSFFTKK
jgi:hypothetical protein